MSLQEDLLRLKELDRSVVRAVIESDVDALVAAINDFVPLRQRLSAQMLEESVIALENDVTRSILKAISGDNGLRADGVIARLLGPALQERVSDKFDEHELQDLGEKLFYSWFSHYEYVAGLSELRPMILRVSTPDAVARLVRQARECYAFQQYDAAYGLCRIVIEASVRDICVRKQLLPELDPNVIPLEKHNWAALRKKVSSGILEERLRNLYAELSVLLHGRKSVTGEEARRAFQQTLEVVEELYAAHGM